jgi:hypothetical protein
MLIIRGGPPATPWGLWVGYVLDEHTLPTFRHATTAFKARVGGYFSSEIDRWLLIQLMHIVPPVGASRRIAFPQTSFQFTGAVSVEQITVKNAATAPVQTVVP